MTVYARQQPGNYRLIRSLFTVGVVGLILAASGITWLLVASAPLAHRAALYSGSWFDKQDPNFIIEKLEINSSWLNITIHALGNCSSFTSLTCDLGTNTQAFTGEEPLTTTFVTTSNGTSSNWQIIMTLSNTSITQLKVVVNNAYTALLDKT